MWNGAVRFDLTNSVFFRIMHRLPARRSSEYSLSSLIKMQNKSQTGLPPKIIVFPILTWKVGARWKGGIRCPIPSLPKPRIRNSVSLPPCPNLSLSMSVQILCLFPTKCPSVLLPLRQNKGTYFYWMMLDSQGSRKDSWQTVKLSLYRLTESQVLTSPNLPDLNESWLMSHNLSHQYDTSQSYAKVKFDFVFLILDRYWAVDIFLSFCPLSNFWDKFMTHNIGSWGPGVTSSKESLPASFLGGVITFGP